MSKNTKVNAAILIIGNEILSGRTQDTNTSTLANWLNSIGVKVNEVRVIPDVEKTIVDTVNVLRRENNYVDPNDVRSMEVTIGSQNKSLFQIILRNHTFWTKPRKE